MLTRDEVIAIENLKSAGARLVFAVPEAEDFVNAINDAIGDLILAPRIKEEAKRDLLAPKDFLFGGSQNWGEHE
jgi:hypothetical protein